MFRIVYVFKTYDLKDLLLQVMGSVYGRRHLLHDATYAWKIGKHQNYVRYAH